MSRFGLDKRFVRVLRVLSSHAVHTYVHTWHVVDSASSNASVRTGL
jgi:phage shock protein PspC (stress-responsive transcriptional regulator)